jgi:hypothetical protein
VPHFCSSRQPEGGVVVAGLSLVAGYLLAISLLMLVSPGTFHTDVGPFGLQNDHYISEADPAWLGPADFIGLTAISVLLAWLLLQVRRSEELG